MMIKRVYDMIAILRSETGKDPSTLYLDVQEWRNLVDEWNLKQENDPPLDPDDTDELIIDKVSVRPDKRKVWKGSQPGVPWTRDESE